MLAEGEEEGYAEGENTVVEEDAKLVGHKRGKFNKYDEQAKEDVYQ